MTMHVFDIRQSIAAALETIPAPEKEATEGSSEPMDWEWTPKPLPVPNLADELENKIKKGKLKANPAEDPGDTADSRERTRRRGTVPPPTPQGSLGSSQNTGRKRRTTLTSKKGSGSGAPPKKPREPGIGGNPEDSSDDSDSNASNNPGELPKKKITSKDLLHKYLKAMVQDYKKRDKADAPKPQPYKGDLEDLERFIRQLENVWALEAHRYKKDITKIRYAANLLQKNSADKNRDPV